MIGLHGLIAADRHFLPRKRDHPKLYTDFRLYVLDSNRVEDITTAKWEKGY
jgi:hypothetical protein